MAVTGALGTVDSYPGNVAPGYGTTTIAPPATGGGTQEGGDTTGTVGFTFTPPVVYDRARTVPYRHPGNVLMRHYSPLPRGKNVYLLVDGTVTETQPWEAQPGTVIRRVFFGAHSEPIDAAEKSLLTAAGYGSYIS